MAELGGRSRLLLTTIVLPLVLWDGVWVSGENPLNVTIIVDYTPPPDAAGLGPNDYWAASGPLNATCVTTGTEGPITYQWSSSCASCSFGFNKTQSIIVPVISSQYTGTSTCLATDSPTGQTKSANIELTVIGAGLLVSLGDNHIHYIQNNSLAYSSDSSFITCYSGSTAESNVGEFIGVDGNIISTVTHPHRGSVSLSLHTADQGIFTCRIPDETGELREVNFGVYPNGFNITPTIGTNDLVFSNGSSSSTLTCTSTGSPATTVTWMRDGEPLTIDGTTYQLTQTVTNRAQSTYENVLTISDELANIIDHMYTCRVSNILGSDSKDIYVGDPPSPSPINPTSAQPPTSPTKTESTAIKVGIAVGISVIVVVFIVTFAVCFTLRKGNTATEYTASNECTTFVSSTSDSQDEPICDARVLYNLSRHHQGYDALAPVGHENVERDRKQISPYHEPSGRGYGGTQSGNYDHIYRHMDDSGRHDKLQHDW